MKLNLGAGEKCFSGYENVDFRPLPSINTVVDLSIFPWQWQDESAEEVMMLDFLEHFPYKTTNIILNECWRVLKPNGEIIIQVPDFEQCSRAIINCPPFFCNRCEKSLSENSENKTCSHCGHYYSSIAEAGVKRLYGAQDYEGNYHFTTFTRNLLEFYLRNSGFCNFKYLEDENDYMRRNWTFKVKATKTDPWGE